MKRGMLTCFFQGFWLVLKNPSLILIKWFLNLSFAALMALPLLEPLARDLDHSATGADVFERLDIGYLREFAAAQGDFLAGMSAYWPLWLIAFALLNLFITGGVIEALRHDRGLFGGAFFRACAHHFPTLIWVGLMGALTFAALVYAPFALIERYARDLLPDPRFSLWFYWAMLAAVAVIALPYVLRIYGFARVLACDATGGHPNRLMRAVKSFAAAVATTGRYFWSSLGLWLLFFIAQIAVVAAYREALPYVGGDAARSLWLETGLAQLALLARIAVGLSTLGGEWRFLEGRTLERRDVEEATPAAPPPSAPPDNAADIELAPQTPEATEVETDEADRPQEPPAEEETRDTEAPDDTVTRELSRIEREALGKRRKRAAEAAAAGETGTAQDADKGQTGSAEDLAAAESAPAQDEGHPAAAEQDAEKGRTTPPEDLVAAEPAPAQDEGHPAAAEEEPHTGAFDETILLPRERPDPPREERPETEREPESETTPATETKPDDPKDGRSTEKL